MHIWEIREYDRQIRSSGVGCSLSKDEIGTSPSEAYDQPTTLPRNDIRPPVNGNHGLGHSPAMERLKWAIINPKVLRKTGFIAGEPRAIFR